jgi:ATP-dependent helicase Lhr and Lhr-like helicase
MNGRAAILDWFNTRNQTPFDFQREAWEAYLRGESGLIHASTGTGKTYAAWLGTLIDWIDQHPDADQSRTMKPPALRALWITPLRALAADTADALRRPLDEIGLPWLLESRTGDTAASVRNKQRTRLPTALVTTPESLSLLLTRADAADLFKHLELVVVDEWHELAASKRGVQTELCLARLRRWRPDLRIWGLSATLGNLQTALTVLLGTEKTGHLIRADIPKTVRIESVIPATMERFPWAGHLGTKLLPQVTRVIEQGQSALVFTNTRAQAELWYQAMIEARPDWAGVIALHHSSLDRKTRDWVENGLRDGSLLCVVCTSSLDLGVDFTPVDSVIQVGSPKGVARLLQRAGRSGHRPGAESKITCVPTHAFELIEVAAARDAIQRNQVEARQPVERPLDVLAQHAVTVAFGGGFLPDELRREVMTTYAYRNLHDDEWAWVLDFITRGGHALQNYPEFARVTVEDDGRYMVKDRWVAQMHRMSIGTIVGDAALRVQFLKGGSLGTIEESFVARLRPGDKFVFAGKILEFVRLREMIVWVRRASGRTGLVPRWGGSRMSFSGEFSDAVRRKIQEACDGVYDGAEMQAVRPILELQARWSKLPAADEILIERAKTRDGYHLFFFPFEGRAVHEGLSALFAYRLGQLQPLSFTIAVNDYGFELLSPDPIPLDEAISAGLFSSDNLLTDIPASLNASEMARRQFREIARVAGLVFQGYPGSRKTNKQLQASSGLLYDVFAKYDPQNLLLTQAHREVLERQLEGSRLGQALERFAQGKYILVDTRRLTPFAFPLVIEGFRDTMTSETLEDRVRKMQLQLEKYAEMPARK